MDFLKTKLKQNHSDKLLEIMADYMYQIYMRPASTEKILTIIFSQTLLAYLPLG